MQEERGEGARQEGQRDGSRPQRQPDPERAQRDAARREVDREGEGGEESRDRVPPLRARAARLLEEHEGQRPGDQRGRHGVVVERHGVGEQGRGEAEAEGQQVRDPRGDGRGLQELAEPDEGQARGDPDDSPDEHEVGPHEMRRRAAEAHPRP